MPGGGRMRLLPLTAFGRNFCDRTFGCVEKREFEEIATRKMQKFLKYGASTSIRIESNQILKEKKKKNKNKNDRFIQTK